MNGNCKLAEVAGWLGTGRAAGADETGTSRPVPRQRENPVLGEVGGVGCREDCRGSGNETWLLGGERPGPPVPALGAAGPELQHKARSRRWGRGGLRGRRHPPVRRGGPQPGFLGGKRNLRQTGPVKRRFLPVSNTWVGNRRFGSVPLGCV